MVSHGRPGKKSVWPLGGGGDTYKSESKCEFLAERARAYELCCSCQIYTRRGLDIYVCSGKCVATVEFKKLDLLKLNKITNLVS